jgi:putative endopeptidase
MLPVLSKLWWSPNFARKKTRPTGEENLVIGQLITKIKTACILALCCVALSPALLSGQEAAKNSEGSGASINRPQLFDPDALDRTVDPCEDFYEYACGSWRKNNPIPSDQVFWARYNQLGEYNREVLHKILEQAAVAPGPMPAAKMVGDFYASCMDEAAANKKGYAPLQPELTRIAAISTREQLMSAVAHFHSMGVPALFEFGSRPDLHDATKETGSIVQGGLGLPDRDYYISQNDKSKETRARYVAHITSMLRLAGEDQIQAERDAAAVLEIETRLAEASWERVRMRDPKNHDHKMKVSDLDALAPNLLFPSFLKATGAPPFTEVNVAPPDFFQQLSATLNAAPLDGWKAYLKWHLVQANARYLSRAFATEDFEFERRYMNGQREPEPRWKMCVSSADRLLGQALGRVYVEQTFGQASRDRMMAMVDLEEATLAQDIQELPWMTPETKQQALVKLKAITNKIGYPGKWLDYHKVKIKRNDLLGNVNQARQFEVRRDLAKIGKQVDKSEWMITTPTVNAYYYTPENSINFPAGVLQPPLFDPNKDDAVNFGAIGWLIGHELTHGFDDEGSKFDGQGNLTNWWTQSDREEFEKRTSCLADQYQQFIVVDDIHLNGRLTLGENTADNGGIRIAFAALHRAMEKDNAVQAAIDGFTADQRFFISFAQQWCANITPERLRVISKVDPHAPVRFRTLGTLRNDPDFAKAFGCKAGQAMVSANSCRVW